MTTGAILLIVISIVAVSDVLIALYFRGVADRVDNQEVVRVSFDPAKARQAATMMLFATPVMWIVVALIAFGVIPSGIDTIQF